MVDALVRNMTGEERAWYGCRSSGGGRSGKAIMDDRLTLEKKGQGTRDSG